MCEERTRNKTKNCQWPFGDPRDEDFHFCMKPVTIDNKSYCDEHLKIAYYSPNEEQKKESAENKNLIKMEIKRRETF